MPRQVSLLDGIMGTKISSLEILAGGVVGDPSELPSAAVVNESVTLAPASEGAVALQCTAPVTPGSYLVTFSSFAEINNEAGKELILEIAAYNGSAWTLVPRSSTVNLSDEGQQTRAVTFAGLLTVAVVGTAVVGLLYTNTNVSAEGSCVGGALLVQKVADR